MVMLEGDVQRGVGDGEHDSQVVVGGRFVVVMLKEWTWVKYSVARMGRHGASRG